MGKREFLV
jgi:hypothetical protein